LLVEVVCAEVLVESSALEHVIADGQNGVGDRNMFTTVVIENGPFRALFCIIFRDAGS